MDFLKTIPAWLLSVVGVYLAVLVSYAVIDGRRIDFFPPSIHAKQLPAPPLEKNPIDSAMNKELELCKTNAIGLNKINSKLKNQNKTLNNELQVLENQAHDYKLKTKQLIGLPCVKCPSGGTVSGVGGDNNNYSELFHSNSEICVSGYYPLSNFAMVRFTKDGSPLKENWGVKAETFRINCN